MIPLHRSAQERIAAVRGDAASLREQAVELRELAPLIAAPVPRERMHALATRAEAAARTMEDIAALLAREVEGEA
jgi:hypothetical protein